MSEDWTKKQSFNKNLVKFIKVESKKNSALSFTDQPSITL